MASKVKSLIITGIYLEDVGPIQSDYPRKFSHEQTDNYNKKYPHNKNFIEFKKLLEKSDYIISTD